LLKAYSKEGGEFSPQKLTAFRVAWCCYTGRPIKRTHTAKSRNEEKQNSESRIQNPEEKRTESVNVVSALYSEF
jgi:hypothetical protein